MPQKIYFKNWMTNEKCSFTIECSNKKTRWMIFCLSTSIRWTAPIIYFYLTSTVSFFLSFFFGFAFRFHWFQKSFFQLTKPSPSSDEFNFNFLAQAADFCSWRTSSRASRPSWRWRRLEGRWTSRWRRFASRETETLTWAHDSWDQWY